MAEKEKIILPPKYYLDYFRYLLDFVRQSSGHCISNEDEKFISTFDALSEDAQCLMVRMVNRKGEYFRLDKLSYEEIPNIPAAAEELVEAGFVSLDPPDDYLLFTLFTKTELDTLYPERHLKSKYKEDILIELAEECTPEDYQKLKDKYLIIHFLEQDQVEYLKLLFFGHYQGMMTEFVVRDIGHVRLENLENHQFTSWFDSREEAMAVFELSKWNRVLKKAMHLLSAEEVLDLIGPINWSIYLAQTKARKTGDKLILQLGEFLEKNNYYEEALSYYSLARKHPARERRIRILEKLGLPDDAREIALVILDHPYNASEKIFAKDYLSKKTARNYRSTTAKIKESPEITVCRDNNTRVELLALNHYQSQGYDGVHSENYLWRGLFGLFFWEELFDHNQPSFHNPLQRMPSDLYNERFYENRKKQLYQKTESFSARKKMSSFIREIYLQKEGISNPLVSWHESLLPGIEKAITHLPFQAIKKILLEIAKNVKDNSSGFPDLFIWNDHTYHFYEVKSPNDHLSAQQLFWIDFFNEQKVKAEILRVNFK